jgi:hypothetical protein
MSSSLARLSHESVCVDHLPKRPSFSMHQLRAFDMAHFRSHNEAIHPYHPEGGPRLCLQWGRYVCDDGSEQWGYRSIWRRPDNSIQSRGPARIPALADIEVLIALASQPRMGRKPSGLECKLEQVSTPAHHHRMSGKVKQR